MSKDKRESYIFYGSFYEAISELPDDVRLCIYDAITEYALLGKEPKVSWICKTVWILIKPQIDANNRRYENWKRGGRPWNKKPKRNLNETKKEPKHNQSITKTKPNENVNENVNEKEKVNIPWVSDETWFWYLEIRKKHKYAMTPYAIKLLEEKIKTFPEDDREKIIKNATMSAWKSFYGLKDDEKEPQVKKVYVPKSSLYYQD